MYQPTIPCPKCGAQNLRGTWVCTHCGATLIVYCPACHAGNASGSKFCQSCGQTLSSAGGASSQAQPPPPPPNAYPQQHDYQQPVYGAQNYQQSYQQSPGGYPPPYDTQQPSRGRGDIISIIQGFFAKAEGFLTSLPTTLIPRLMQIVRTTNPILLSSLVVTVVGMAVFLILAFQLGWIKTSEPASTAAAVTDKTPPVISMVQVEAGDAQSSAIISWVTDEYSSSQVKYGVWPYANTMTPIQNDPTTGVNTGVLIHKVGLSSLIATSTYVYQCISIDKYGNKSITPEVQFQTTK